MKKTLFLSAILGAACCSSVALAAWDGGNTGSIDTNWAGITVGEGYYCNNNINGVSINDSTHSAIGITPEGNSTTAHLAAANVADGTQVYVLTSQWGSYNREFADLTIDELNFGEGSGGLNVLAYTGKQPSSMTVNVKSVAGTLSGVSNSGALSLGSADADTQVAGAISNSGTMVLNGTFTFDVSDMGRYTMVDHGSMTAPEAGQNGFESGTATYALISGLTNLTYSGATLQTTAGDTVSAGNDALVVTKSGQGTKYYIQNGDSVQLSTIKEAGSVSAVHVSDGTLAIDTTGIGLTDVTGEGNVVLSQDATVAGGSSTTVTGALTVNGVQLSVGDGDGKTASISSFGSVVLDGGTIRFNNKLDTFNNLTVESGKTGTINSFDMGARADGAALTLAGTTTVNGELTIQNQWNAQFVVDDLSGTGTLNIKGTNGGDSGSEPAYYSMKLDNFSGTIAIASSNATVKRTFATLSELSAAQTNYTVTGGTITNVCTANFSEGEVTLGDTACEISGTISGGTINGGSADVTISGNVTGGTINGNNHITISGQISGGSVENATLSGNVISGGSINNVTLAAGERLNVQGGGSVTIGNVTHATTGGAYGYGLIVNGNTALTMNGEADFTSNEYSKIGIQDGSSLIVANGGDVTCSQLGWSDNSMNGTTTVNQGGSLTATSAYVKSFTNAGTTEMSGSLNAETIVNSGSLTVNNLAALSNGADVTLNGGSLDIKNEARIASLTLGTGAEITINDHAGTLTTSALTVNGDSTVNANLVFAENSAISFTEGSVTLGCNIDFGTGTTIALGESYLDTLRSDGKVLLFSDVEHYSDNLESIAVTGNFTGGHLLAELQGNGTYNIYATPEPATATLSLLALAGLVARRRRR